MNNVNNRIELSGTVDEGLLYSHRLFGEDFYNFTVAVKRKSGVEDILPVTVSERLLSNHLTYGDRCEIDGQVRTYNEYSDERTRLKILVFCRDLHTYGKDSQNCVELCTESKGRSRDRNDVFLEGYICRPAFYRISPLGREICDIMLAVNRVHGKSDYIPCIAWGRNARYASTLVVGNKVRIAGRLQSRAYRKYLEDGSSEIRTAYEVSVMSMEAEYEQSDRGKEQLHY